MGPRPGLVQRCSNGWHAVRESPAGRNPLDTQRQQVAPQLLPVVKQTEVLGLEPAPPALKPVFLPQLPDQKARVMHCGESWLLWGKREKKNRPTSDLAAPRVPPTATLARLMKRVTVPCDAQTEKEWEWTCVTCHEQRRRTAAATPGRAWPRADSRLFHPHLRGPQAEPTCTFI